ncbi:2327_t:CDS:2 [Funneliformis geosporum]|uniref:2327_t:CDS:1 n=1 Tax=Funneliformis geosporum TaxID=1117311 RepID=A0A9W4T338_9GLOM|nr:2327_t:CDS:2 [Funneliformis geosporum]
MLKAIERKAAELEQEELDKPRKMREEAIKSVEDYREENEKQLPEIKKIIEKFTEKINNTPVNDLSSVIEKAIKLIDEKRKNKVKPNPVRGEMNPNDLSNLDNNALFYGAPRTGKSVMTEKLAYEADIYPLVVVQGSSLTPNKSNRDANVDVLLKFFFTLSSITYDLADDYGFERAENGEVRHILFLDEADQICTNNFERPKDASTELTFLKECMGTGRLSNPLSFSWTLNEFISYSDDAGISSQFPQHWIENKTLKDEDNKLYDSKQLESFAGKFENPRSPKIEEVLVNVEQTMKLTANKISEDISKAIDSRLNELNDTAKDIKDEIQTGQDNMNRDVGRALDRMSQLLSEIGGNIGSRGRNRSP